MRRSNSGSRRSPSPGGSASARSLPPRPANSLEVAGDLGELDWAMAIGDELLGLDFAPSDRSSLLRGINQVRLLRGEPVDDLFAEHAKVLVDGVDLQEVSNYEGADGVPELPRLRLRRRCRALGEGRPGRRRSMRASDLPRAARAAIWGGDLPTAERLTAEFAQGLDPRSVRTRPTHRAHRGPRCHRPDVATKRSPASRRRSRPCASWGSKSTRC